MPRVGLVGNGYLGQAYERMFPDAVVYDEPKGLLRNVGEIENYNLDVEGQRDLFIKTGRAAINECDIAIVAVPTDPLEDGSLNMSIVEDVVGWLDTETILLKSALMPGTTDRLVEETGKNIAISVEMIGMGNYYIDPNEYPDPKDPWKHKTLIVGGEEPARSKAAEVLWDKMQPDIDIHLVTAKEAEIVKLVENSYPAMKVSFINALYELTEKADVNFINTHQAWSSDSRVDGFHMRTTSFKRGWKSHCWDKDIPALSAYAKSIGADTMGALMDTVLEVNEEHKKQ